MPPDQVACLPATTGIFHHGLSVRCVLGQGLTTYRTVPYLWQGQVAARNKYGGYWNKTQSTADSGGLSISCMTCITQISQPTESPLIIPYNAIPDITVPTKTGDKLTPTQGRGFPGFLSGMHIRHMRTMTITSISTSNSKEYLQYAFMQMIVSPREFFVSRGGVITELTNTQKDYARVQNACLHGVER